MRIVRYFLVAALLSPVLLVVPGCSGENVDKAEPATDTSKAFKSSEEATKEMNKNNVLPQKR